MARVWVAMSGGVDSSVTASLLVREGHDVTGVTMRLLSGDSPDGVRSARRVCDVLGIPHHTLDFADFFSREVVEPYLDAYCAGSTPNPCVVCNDRVKAGELLRRVTLQGADLLATGHYARIERDADGAPWLARALDAARDQSYFLYGIDETALARMVFPLGGLTKARVRELAREAGLPAAERPDSQEACFAPRGPVALLEANRPEALVPGSIVDRSGSVLGTHRGAARYTVGQRRGLALAGGPWYVTAVDPAGGTVTVGPSSEAERSTVRARREVWRSTDEEMPVRVRVRSRGADVAAVVRREGAHIVCVLSTPVSGVAPGQALVCWQGDRVVAGGTIEEAS